MSKKLAFPKLRPLKQIRRKCIEVCMTGSKKSVLFCCDTECPHWYLRLGMQPSTAINQNGKRYEEVFKPENFKKGGKFDPAEEVSTFKI